MPPRTPSAEGAIKASDAAKNTVHFPTCLSDANSNVANWVLSPSSATNTAPNTTANAFQSPDAASCGPVWLMDGCTRKFLIRGHGSHASNLRIGGAVALVSAPPDESGHPFAPSRKTGCSRTQTKKPPIQAAFLFLRRTKPLSTPKRRLSSETVVSSSEKSAPRLGETLSRVRAWMTTGFFFSFGGAVIRCVEARLSPCRLCRPNKAISVVQRHIV